jgi:hypothetical protein
MSVRDQIITRVMEAGGRLTVRSALNPILWLCAIVCVPALTIYSLLSNPAPWLAYLICGPVAVALIGFLFLLIFDRDKLQSEGYQLRKREIELIEEKGQPAIPAITVEAISEPESLELNPAEDAIDAEEVFPEDCESESDESRQ